MVNPASSAASPRPIPELDGWDPSWSRTIDAPDHTGQTRSWHLLDTGPEDATFTVLAVHGNPTWSYTWRHLAAALPDDVRLIAPDQLDMGFSDRTGVRRRLADRIDDLVALTATLDLTGDVVVVAHDWGGPVSLGWLQRMHSTDDAPVAITGLVLTNTAVHQPPEATAPTLIRNARRPLVLQRVTVQTTTFLRGMFELSNPRTSPAARTGYLAPYLTADRRRAIADFVEDIPLEDDHPSAATLDTVAGGLADLGDIPTLLVWGAGDRVFSDLYLHDLEARLPHADVHRHPTAGHLVSEDTDVASVVVDWLAARGVEQPNPPASTSTAVDLTAALGRRELADRVAITEIGTDRTVTFAELDWLVGAAARGMLDTAGIGPGDRVALMIPPGVDLAIAVYACWRAGAVPVLIDGGLGPRQMSAAMRVSTPDHLIGIRRALTAARGLGWPGRRISVDPLPGAARRLLGVDHDLASLSRHSSTRTLPVVDSDAEAAVVFTSGATGPSKGVRYSATQIAAQIDTLMSLYDITADDSLVAAFAPFALYGPAMGITSTVPEMDVSAPGTLTASALIDAVEAVDASLVFASPAAIMNLLATADEVAGRPLGGMDAVRLLLSAGAPVPESVLRQAVDTFFPNADGHTPYGMTECLPVADIGLRGLREAQGHALTRVGVCVGPPATGVEVLIDPLDTHGQPRGEAGATPDRLGEVWVRAAHQRLGYERRWHTTHLATRPGGWHATGDLGALDAEGRLWIGGRLGHVITAPSGPLAPAGIERSIDALPGVTRSAAVGVGPVGTQAVVVITERRDVGRRPRQAPLDRIDLVRSATADLGVDIAACLEVSSLPVDRRHNSKIDRAHLARWASGVLEGGPVRNP
ncbi:MAG: alpha/beta fold hydrolase [Actinomycetota bacterium]